VLDGEREFATVGESDTEEDSVHDQGGDAVLVTVGSVE
jgi:hypothetical protein